MSSHMWSIDSRMNLSHHSINRCAIYPFTFPFIRYLNLVSFHFYYLITLTYVTSRVLRLPWGHGIICHIRQPLLGQVFEIWLIFRYHHASSSRRCLFDVWIRFSCGFRWLGIIHLMMNDLMSSDFSTYCTFNAILGHIPFQLRFVYLHGVACSSPLTGYMPRWWPVCYLIMIL